MRMSIKQLDELVKLLELFERDETIVKVDEHENGKLSAAVKLIKDIAIDIIV